MRLSFTTLLAFLFLVGNAIAGSGSFCTPGKIGEVRQKENTKSFHVDVAYPVLCSEPATRLLRDHVADAVRDFKETDPEHDLAFFPHPYEMIVQYDTIPAAHGRLLAVSLITMVYTGGAHPNNWPDAWTFDLTDGHALTLDDIFPAPEGALQVLAPFVRARLRESLQDMVLDDMLLPGTEPTRENYAKYFLSDQGLTFLFGPYQVAPYAAGEQRVTIPMDRLMPLLRPTLTAVFQ
ncbi:DUF3298 domain-containing protein [Pseudodesulfovibrio sp.]|uniref:DUF3298 and DUF4163 domain-containing protein n=1 Tax=unclassified Pseudodesulfovibrio TaxID=2661612 RepID=UPI003B008FC3